MTETTMSGAPERASSRGTSLARRIGKAAAVLVAVAVVAGLGYWAYGVFATEGERGGGANLPTGTVEVRDITVSVSATGVLRPVRIVEVKSKASGEIVRMAVELGDRVERGDLLAQIDTEILEQELAQARADLQSARTRMEIGGTQFERAEKLLERGLISELDFEENRQTFANAEAALLRVEAAVKLAEERLRDATVTAPISGTIISKNVEEGQVITSSMSNVSGGTALVEMADLAELEVRTLVDEIDIGRVRPGLPVRSTVEAYPERGFQGTVIKIEPQAVVEQQVTTFPVLSRIDNADRLLLPGMNADVEVILHERPDVLAVPNEAVRTPDDARTVARLVGLEAEDAALPPARRGNRSGGGPGGAPRAAGEEAESLDAAAAFGVGAEPRRSVVFVLGEGGRIEARTITTGVRDWEHTEVVSGLEAGERVAILPSTSLLMSQEELRQRFARRFSVIPGS